MHVLSAVILGVGARLARALAYLQAQIALDSHDCKYFKTSHPKSRH